MTAAIHMLHSSPGLGNRAALKSESSAGYSSRSSVASKEPRVLSRLWGKSHRRERESSQTSQYSRLPNNAARPKLGGPKQFPARAYEFEWQEPSFFKDGVDEAAPLNPVLTPRVVLDDEPPTALPPQFSPERIKSGLKTLAFPPEEPTTEWRTSVQEAEPVARRDRGNTRETNALRVWSLNLRLEKFLLMEVAWGTHQLVEMSVAEVIKRVRMHGRSVEQMPISAAKTSKSATDDVNRKGNVGELTYRDIRQIFSNGCQQFPTLEIRKNCILLCFPPLTAIVFHDRCVFLINDEIDVDSLILRLEEITGTYSNKAEETEKYFRESLSDKHLQALKEHGPSRFFVTDKKNMLLGGDSTESADKPSPDLHPEFEIPRFVLFPLEFAILEILITCAFDSFNDEIEGLERRQELVRGRVKSDRQPKIDRLEELHEIKAPIEGFIDKMVTLNKCFKEILSAQEHMSYMELTKLFYKPHLYHRWGPLQSTANPNLEILLEFFDQEVEQFQRRGVKALRNVENAERYVNLKMALTRNELFYWDLTSTLITMGFGAGACISGTFGMNLKSQLEENDWAFYFFTGTILIAIGLALSAVGFLRHKYG